MTRTRCSECACCMMILTGPTIRDVGEFAQRRIPDRTERSWSATPGCAGNLTDGATDLIHDCLDHALGLGLAIQAAM